MPIPLLNFPSDLLRDLFKEYDPFDLYKLSKCSKRTQKSIMMNASTSNWKIKGNDKEIDVLCGNSRYRFIKTSIPTAYYKYAKKPSIVWPLDGTGEGHVHRVPKWRIHRVIRLSVGHISDQNCGRDKDKTFHPRCIVWKFRWISGTSEICD
ncbi:hypothetical protein B9Z55_003131 [Caenorhabditis nigoni]|uniref:F-box domain-containing protein n=1 Tax=Caenorhabditis nigoni TaxID=1611254 RepID=A0A2G5VNS6_9PELO|nr:hypothetical protein B9Z55_003131 [Caenorhabditis nigoni]